MTELAPIKFLLEQSLIGFQNVFENMPHQQFDNKGNPLLPSEKFNNTYGIGQNMQKIRTALAKINTIINIESNKK
jgi:hypothetical protein